MRGFTGNSGMSFLNQLKSQAQSVQAQQVVEAHGRSARIEAVERVTQRAWRYLDELAAQLRILQPDGPRLSADGKTPWPAMKASDFRTDARKKMLDGKEVFDYAIMGWTLSPKMGVVVQGSVSAVLMAEVQAIEARLASGQVQFEKVEKRVPPRNALESVRFTYATQARGTVHLKPDHEQGQVLVRLSCVTGLESRTQTWHALDFDEALLDELAKLVVGQDNRFF